MLTVATPKQKNLFFGINENSDSGVPDALIKTILFYLDVNSLTSGIRSCKKFHQLGNESNLWKALCIRDFFTIQSLDKVENWKSNYQRCLGLEYLQIPFPGIGGVFHPDPNENWKAHYMGGQLIRELRFVNGTNGSLFSEFSLLGYTNGSIALSIKLSSNNNDSLSDYLKIVEPSGKLRNSLFEPVTVGFQSNMHISDSYLMKIAFRIICHFHEIPEESRGFMRKIIWAESWTCITPLTAEEILKINSVRKRALDQDWKGLRNVFDYR